MLMQLRADWKLVSGDKGLICLYGVILSSSPNRQSVDRVLAPGAGRDEPFPNKWLGEGNQARFDFWFSMETTLCNNNH